MRNLELGEGGVKKNIPCGILLALAALALMAGGAVRPVEASEAKLHHLHLLMNQGLGMVTEGANLIILAEMKMASELDEDTRRHGEAMMIRGRKLIERAVEGPERKRLAEEAGDGGALVRYTRELGDSMRELAGLLEDMDFSQAHLPEAMALYHMQVNVNHAVQMAARGTTLVMLGQMGMAGAVDDIFIEQGARMREEALAMHRELMRGSRMTDLPTYKGPGESPLMMRTHGLAASCLRVMDLLGRMPDIK
jgi:hypothetical protein